MSSIYFVVFLGLIFWLFMASMMADLKKSDLSGIFEMLDDEKEAPPTNKNVQGKPSIKDENMPKPRPKRR